MMKHAGSEQGEKNSYIVIQETGGAGPCRVIRATDVYAAIYTQVYGPASRAECEAWAARNCKG